MITDPGRLNRRVDVFTNTTVAAEFDTVKAKPLYKRIAAAILPARGREYREANIAGTKAAVKVVIRYRKDITPSCIVVYGSHVYDVVDVVDPEAAHESLELYCSETLRDITPAKKPSEEEWVP